MLRYTKLGLLATLLVGIAFFYPLLAPIRHRIDPDHFKSIRDGMSLPQVEAIIGVPPGEYGAETDSPMSRLMMTMMHDYYELSHSRRNLLTVKAGLEGRTPTGV